MMDWINRIDKKYGWSLIGTLLAVLFGLAALYVDFVRKSNPRIEFEVVGNAPILNITETLAELRVTYEGQDLSSQGNTLSFVLVRIANRGDATVLQSSFDARAPVGFSIAPTTLIQAEVSDASNNYLRDVGKISVDKSRSSVQLEPLIIENDEWLLVKALVMHRVTETPRITSMGKLAGMTSPPNIVNTLDEPSPGFFSLAFGGGATVQFVRGLLYTFVTVLISLGLLVTYFKVSRARDTKRRKAVVRKYRRVKGIPEESSLDVAFESFIKHGDGSLRRLLDVISDAEGLEKVISRYHEKELGSSPTETEEDEPFVPLKVYRNGVRVKYLSAHVRDVERLLSLGVLKLTEGRASPDREMIERIENFLESAKLLAEG